MSKKCILIIEDDPDVLEMMQIILEEAGYSVVASKECWPAEDIKMLMPDLVLIDNRLADGSGKDTCKELKENESTKKIPVILVSANRGLEQMALESHADGFLSKPFDIIELVTIAQSWT